jgi:hypothetical protein
VDNATSFSPPDSRVEVRGNLVGKGVVVEVEDQGLGIPTEERERLNAILRNPPDFEVMALAEHMRLGLFVVAQLAARHGIVVTLTDSAFGGIHAIVLVPAVLMATKQDPENRGQPMSPAYTPPQRARQPAAVYSGQSRVEPASGGDLAATPVRWPEEEPVSVSDAPPRWAQPHPSDGHRTNGTTIVRNGQSRHANGRDGRDGREGKAPLPRRRRQANLSPHLMADLTSVDDVPTTDPGQTRSPEQVRDTMSAFLRGTEKGRHAPPQSQPRPTPEPEA